jgi:protein-S-isoprenylcysteine O-methyltransferase Ste14
VGHGSDDVVAFRLWPPVAVGAPLLAGQQTHEMIEEGPYRVSRNPLYLGLVTSYVGLGLLTDSLWALLLTPAAVAAIEWGAIRPEETYLRQRFGAKFEEYARRTRRWI